MTAYNCIRECMKKTNDLYEHFGDKTKTGILMFENITDENKEDIIEYFDAKNWEMLRFFLGAPLPEVNDETCFKSKATLRNNELGFKELRNILCWQMWTEKLCEVFATFNEDVEEVFHKQHKSKLVKAIFRGDQETINEIKLNDLGIFDYLNDDNGQWKTNAKEEYLAEFKKSENKITWFVCKFMESYARTKQDMMTDVQLVSKKRIHLAPPKHIRHMLHFMSYISMTETELSKSIKILDALHDADEQWFQQTIGKDNK